MSIWLRSRPLAALIVGVSIFAAICVAVTSFISYRSNDSGGFTATGSATRDFTSDLIVWHGSYEVYGLSTREAYQALTENARIVKEYLTGKGVPEDSVVFSAVNIRAESQNNYDEFGNHLFSEVMGYWLTQRLTIQSSDVDLIEGISRSVTELIDRGVNFSSEDPEYYYTKLDELKLQLISEATENARARIDLMADDARGQVGKLLSSTLGTFQITAQNSSSDEYSAGGTFNTWSREKTIFISVKLHYAVK